MITDKQLEELIAITVQDFPLQPIEDVLMIPCKDEWEKELMMNYIKEYYSPEEVLRGMDIVLERLRFMNKLYGVPT